MSQANTTVTQMFSESVSLGDELPVLVHKITAKDVVSGAAASRDWQPLHHDYPHAVERAGTGNIIMNTSTQQGWVSRYATDWAGPAARFFAISIKMKSSLCPGDELSFSGKINQVSALADGLAMVNLAIIMSVGDRVATEAAVSVILPGKNSRSSVWDYAGESLREYAL